MTDIGPTKGADQAHTQTRTKRLRKRRPPVCCLYCSQPFEVERATEDCPHCGTRNLHADQVKYRTLRPRARATETALKTGIVLVVGAITLLLFLTPGGFGMGQGWAIGFPILIAWVFWDAASMVTQRRGILNHAVFWPAMFAGLGVGPCLFFGALMFLIGVREPVLFLSLAAVGATFSLLGWGLGWLTNRDWSLGAEPGSTGHLPG